ncbi:MAG: hypothetical protein EF813_09140 [Methanosarcinales archaeon]|nr:MAG: hypothetical protein EF813_09140 [Methanosarcinales archaeon]
MAKEIVIKNCTLDEFSKMFGTKKEYVKLIQEMGLKERILSPKPTNALEANIKNNIIDNALIKMGSSALKVTSYSVKKDQDHNIVYISYAGKRLRSLSAGRLDDFGGFFDATQTGSDFKINIKTRYEYYKMWYGIATSTGLMFFIVPGLIIFLWVLIYHTINSSKINKFIVQILIKTFESSSGNVVS